VALLHDYDARFALQVQPTNPVLAYEETVQQHYESLRRLGLGVDVVSPAHDLSQYRVVVAPGLLVMDEMTAAALTGYVEAGGTLVLAPRTAIKDRCNAAPERPLPAWLDELAGLEVVDYASLPEDSSARLAGVGGASFAGEVHGWYEELELRGGRATATYVDGAFPGTPAVVEHSVGAGRCVYLAGVASAPTLHALYRRLCDDLGLRLLELPEGVEAVPMAANGGDLLMLLNHRDDEAILNLGSRALTLEPLDVALVDSPSATGSGLG
jgi:beta-galactosidase